VKYLDIGIQGRQCGGTACDFATLGAIIDEVQVSLGGEGIVNIHFRDLLTLNHIWEDIYPHLLLGAGAANFCAFEGVRLPLHVTKFGKSLSCKFTYAANANVMEDAANQLLSVAYQYRGQPFANHYNYQYKEHVALAAATWYEIPLDYAGAELLGILVYSQIIRTTTALTRTVARCRVSVDDREIYDEDWQTMTRSHVNTDTSDDANWGAESDNYRWLDFSQEHLPAGKLRLFYMTQVDTTHMARFIPVYVQKNQAQ
jgi:hypothetical protein